MDEEQALKIAKLCLDKLLAGDQEVLKRLRYQLRYADELKVVDLNSAGFFVDFNIAETSEQIAVTPRELYIGDVDIANVHPFEDAYVDCIIFVKKGLLQMLEISFIDVPDNYDITGARFTYRDNPRDESTWY